MSEFRILFCCMGNLCRSPMAAGLLRQLAQDAGVLDRLSIDSAGTHAYFPNAPADPRASRVLAIRGIDISGHRARKITRTDFERFDLILAMDQDNFNTLLFTAPKAHTGKIAHVLDYAPREGVQDIPDPYCENEAAFLAVLELLKPALEGLLKHLRQKFL